MRALPFPFAAGGLWQDRRGDPSPQRPQVPLVVGVTSHRDLAADEIDGLRQRVRAFFAALERDFPALPLVVLSALAEGGDQLIAHEALRAGARLIATLPLPRALYVQDFADTRWRSDFDALCEQATVVCLPLREGRSWPEVEASGTARDCQYAQAGVHIASHCHILLALWDGKESSRLGGTAQIVTYHLTGAIPGLIDRRHRHRHVLGVGDERLLYHIACSREGTDGAPATGLQPLQATWRSAFATAPGDAGMPPEFRQMFAYMAVFNADCHDHAEALEAALREERNVQAAIAPHAGIADTAGIDHRFQAADWLAVHYRKRVLLAMRLIYSLAAVMGIAFTWYAHILANDALIYVFLLLFVLGALVAVLARRRDWHRKYLDYRALAEGLRIQSYWRRAGISMTRDQEFAHDDFLQKQNVELGWIRNVMRAAGLPLATPVAAGPAALSAVIAEWVGASGRSGQLDYYERKSAECASLHRITETVGAISLWGGIGISVFLALFAFGLSHDSKSILVTVMAVLSIVAAVREAYAYRKADKMLIKQYRFMQRIFAGARAALDRTEDAAERRAILRALGHAALTEHAEWTLMQRERQVEHGKL